MFSRQKEDEIKVVSKEEKGISKFYSAGSRLVLKGLRIGCHCASQVMNHMIQRQNVVITIIMQASLAVQVKLLLDLESLTDDEGSSC